MTPKTKKIIKISILSTLTAIFSFLAFSFLGKALILGTISGLWPAIVSFLLLIIFLCLEVVFIPDTKFLFFLVFVQTVLPVFSFLNIFDSFKFIFLIFLLFFSFVYWGIEKGRNLFKNSIEIKFLQISKLIIPKIITGLLIFCVFILYFHYVSLGYFNEKMAKDTFNKVLNSFEPAFSVWISGIHFNMTVDEAMEVITISNYRKNKVEILDNKIDFDTLQDSQKEIMINEGVNKLKEKLDKNFGKIDGSKLVRDQIFSILSAKISKLPPIVKNITGGGFLLIMFFVLKGIAFIFYPIISFIAFVFYKIFLVAKFGNVELIDSRKEIIYL